MVQDHLAEDIKYKVTLEQVITEWEVVQDLEIFKEIKLHQVAVDRSSLIGVLLMEM